MQHLHISQKCCIFAPIFTIRTMNRRISSSAQRTSFVHRTFSLSTLYIVPLYLLFLLLASCSPHQPQYRIGVSQCLDDAWRQKMNYEMERELLLHPDMSLSTRVAHGSNELQCQQIDSFIRERVDLLIVSPNEAEQVKSAVTRAYRAGIPVIVADRRVTGNEWTAFIGGDNYKVGLLMAEWVEKHRSAQSRPLQVLEVCGLAGSTPATLRHKGLTDGLAPQLASEAVTISSVNGFWQKEDAFNAVTEWLLTHPEPDVIVAQNDLMAVGAAQAVGKSIPVMGVDGISVGLQAIADGLIECTATYSSRGDMIIDAAAHILAGEPYVKDTVLETTMIDATAARALLIQYNERLHDLETLKIVQLRSDTMWHEMHIERRALILCLVGVLLLFLLALAFLLWKQQGLQRELTDEVVPQLEDMQEAIQLSRRDEAFAERLKQVVDEHLTDPNLNVEYLGSMLQLSRTQLFRRVKNITGKGPLDYIRERRLIKADELLHTTDMTIQQVAMEYCFSSPGYFTKCYKAYFGHLPSSIA